MMKRFQAYIVFLALTFSFSVSAVLAQREDPALLYYKTAYKMQRSLFLQGALEVIEKGKINQQEEYTEALNQVRISLHLQKENPEKFSIDPDLYSRSLNVLLQLFKNTEAMNLLVGFDEPHYNTHLYAESWPAWLPFW
jgi:hypothetical protein